jgi:hypothetical protein
MNMNIDKDLEQVNNSIKWNFNILAYLFLN